MCSKTREEIKYQCDYTEKKEKKSELQEFDKIVKNNFKKKTIPQFIGE